MKHHYLQDLIRRTPWWRMCPAEELQPGQYMIMFDSNEEPKFHQVKVTFTAAGSTIVQFANHEAGFNSYELVPIYDPF